MSYKRERSRDYDRRDSNLEYKRRADDSYKNKDNNDRGYERHHPYNEGSTEQRHESSKSSDLKHRSREHSPYRDRRDYSVGSPKHRSTFDEDRNRYQRDAKSRGDDYSKEERYDSRKPEHDRRPYPSSRSASRISERSNGRDSRNHEYNDKDRRNESSQSNYNQSDRRSESRNSNHRKDTHSYRNDHSQGNNRSVTPFRDRNHEDSRRNSDSWHKSRDESERRKDEYRDYRKDDYKTHRNDDGYGENRRDDRSRQEDYKTPSRREDDRSGRHEDYKTRRDDRYQSENRSDRNQGDYRTPGRKDDRHDDYRTPSTRRDSRHDDSRTPSGKDDRKDYTTPIRKDSRYGDSRNYDSHHENDRPSSSYRDERNKHESNSRRESYVDNARGRLDERATRNDTGIQSPIYKENVKKSDAQGEKQQRILNLVPPPPPPSSARRILRDRERKMFSNLFEKLNLVGEGTYGKVFKARNKETGELCAVKQIRKETEKEGISITTIREIKYLQSVSHPNIVDLKCVIQDDQNLCLVFDYLDYDLSGLVMHPRFQLSHSNIKWLTFQLLQALECLHERDILHRDLKASNLLIDKNGDLKLADFGLARCMDFCKNTRIYTNRVITLWYRPPELLLGTMDYTGEVDIWSAGCIMMEMFLGKPLFNGSDEISQLDSIYELLGTIDDGKYPEAKELPWYNLLMPKASRPSKLDEFLQEHLPTDQARDLVRKMLEMRPKQRISAKEALNHAYFKELPKVSPPDVSMIDEDYHELDTKKK